MSLSRYIRAALTALALASSSAPSAAQPAALPPPAPETTVTPANRSLQRTDPTSGPDAPPEPQALEAEAPGAVSAAIPDASSRDPRAVVAVRPSSPAGSEQPEERAIPVSGMSFTPGKGLTLESADRAFALTLRLRAQLLYTADGTEAHDKSNMQESFQLRRARLQLGGHFFGADNELRAVLALSPTDVGMRTGSVPQTSPLLDLYVQFKQLRSLNLRLGQYRVPLNRQRLVSSGDLHMVDRSIVDAEFALDRDLGLDIRSEDFLHLGFLRYYAGVFTGEGRNTNGLSDFGMLYSGRIEVLPLGMFRDDAEGDLQYSESPKLSLGLAYAYHAHARFNRGTLGESPVDGGTTNLHNLAADFVLRALGLSLEGELMWRHGKRRPGTRLSGTDTPDDPSDDDYVIEQPRNGWGLMTQAGIFLRGTPFEIVARASLNRSVGNSSLTERNEYGLGVSYYFAGHPFKLQADVFRIGAKAPDAKGYVWEDRIRVQLQAGF